LGETGEIVQLAGHLDRAADDVARRKQRGERLGDRAGAPKPQERNKGDRYLRATEVGQKLAVGSFQLLATQRDCQMQLLAVVQPQFSGRQLRFGKLQRW